LVLLVRCWMGGVDVSGEMLGSLCMTVVRWFYVSPLGFLVRRVEQMDMPAASGQFPAHGFDFIVLSFFTFCLPLYYSSLLEGLAYQELAFMTGFGSCVVFGHRGLFTFTLLWVMADEAPIAAR